MKSRGKILTSITSVMLSVTLLITFVLFGNKTNNATQTAVTRTVELSQSALDVQSVFDEFEDSSLIRDGSTVYFEGYKSIDSTVLSDADYISESDIENLENCVIKYNFSYDTETNIVTISALATLQDGTVQVDEITGVGFLNDKNEIDAVMNIDGEGILLSEMRNAGMIENCGWFSRLIKNVISVVVTSVVVAATVAVVVATAGVAAPALVAVGVGAISTTIGVGAGVVAGAIFYTTIGRAAIEAGTALGEYLGNGAELIIDKVSGAIIAFIWDRIEYEMEKLTDTIRYEMRYGGYRIAAVNKEESCVYVSATNVGFSLAVALLSSGNSVYNYTSSGAYEAAKSAGGGLSPLYHAPHDKDKKTAKFKKGVYYEHWHVYNHNTDGHAFFGTPVYH